MKKGFDFDKFIQFAKSSGLLSAKDMLMFMVLRDCDSSTNSFILTKELKQHYLEFLEITEAAFYQKIHILKKVGLINGDHGIYTIACDVFSTKSHNYELQKFEEFGQIVSDFNALYGSR